MALAPKRVPQQGALSPQKCVPFAWACEAPTLNLLHGHELARASGVEAEAERAFWMQAQAFASRKLAVLIQCDSWRDMGIRTSG